MERDLFLDILDENPNINEYDLEQIESIVEMAIDEEHLDKYDLDKEFYKQLIDFMDDNRYELLTMKRLKEFLSEYSY